ncbi:MAG: outer membrane beta-barrel protein [Ekhidna sp.]|uniref:outer membrane beta-barrel protein n=1 Tax=Ekhidna sp. TaxID=2608089 RepID=UPI0032ED3190
MKKHLITCCLFFISLWGFSQTSSQCARSLAQAELAFEQGRLSDIINTYTDEASGFTRCLNGGVFSVEEEIRAYKLLTKAYLFQDDEAMAEEMFVKLLKADKEHQLSPEDPAELYLLKDKFKTEPILRVAVRVGANKSLPSVIQNFNTFQVGDKRYNESGAETGLGIGFWFEALAERHLTKGIEVATGIQYRIASYEVEGDLIENDLNYVAKNTSNMLRFPLLVRYSLNYDKKDKDGNRKKILPYVFIGGSYDLMLKAKYVDTRRTGGTAYTLPDESEDLTASDQVAKSNISIIGGLGARFRVGRSEVDFFSMEVRYDNSLFNYINPDNRWVNEDVNFGIGHVEDDLTLNTLSFSVGYTRSLYIPRKRKQYR